MSSKRAPGRSLDEYVTGDSVAQKACQICLFDFTFHRMFIIRKSSSFICVSVRI